MGIWGYYDDQSDDLLDIWDTITYNYCKINYPEMIKLSQNDYPKYLDESEKIIKKDKVKFSEFVYKNSNKEHALGLAIKLINVVNGTGLLNKKKLPKKLFNGFSENLRKMACSSLINEKKNLIKQNWNSIEKREKALEEEEKLFKCKINKISVSRKSPSISATKCKEGTIKTGLDRNKWKVILTKTGVKRWKKTKNLRSGI